MNESEIAGLLTAQFEITEAEIQAVVIRVQELLQGSDFSAAFEEATKNLKKLKSETKPKRKAAGT